MDGLGKGVTAEQRERDGRLAWIVVSICAVLSLTLVVLGVRLAYSYATGWIEQDMARKQAEVARERERFGYPPLSVPTAPPPPSLSTAAPIGDPAAWIGPNDYPSGARRRGEEGRVQVTVAIDPRGTPTGCQTYVSSGFYSLDTGTCDVFLRKGRFEAAPPGEVGVRKWTSPAIRWELPE
jgi:TonB family protein